MRVGLLVIAFNVDQWIYEMLENASPHVDIAYIAYPSRPWRYSERARKSEVNPTILDEDKLRSLGIRYKIVKGDWDYDEDTRNDIRKIATAESCDWLVVQDADEFYDEDGWKRLKDLMRMHLGKEVAISTQWLNFWKNTDYIITNRDGSITSANECAALSLSGSSCFTYSRTVSCQVVSCDAICYHLGYVMDDDKVKIKVNTWTHTADVDIRGWYRLKWMGWRVETKYIHPGNPPVWDRAVRKPAEIVLPRQCSRYSEVIMRNTYSDGKARRIESVLDFIYNGRALSSYKLKRIKARAGRIIRSVIGK